MNRKIVVVMALVIVFLVGCNNPNENSRTTQSEAGRKGLLKAEDVQGQTPKVSQAVKKKKLTMEIVKELSKKGNDLEISDFENYIGTDIGSGLYIVKYQIDNKFSLLVGSSAPEGKPLYVMLEKEGVEKGIDIRMDDIDSFIKN